MVSYCNPNHGNFRWKNSKPSYIVGIIQCSKGCNDANAIPTRTQYADMYAVVIAGWYGWEEQGGQGMGCEWLAGLVCRVCLYVDCMDGMGWEVWGSCAWNGVERFQISLYTDFFPCRIFSEFGSSYLC